MPSRAPGAASPKAKAAPRIGLLSLGCAKALVDSEQILTRLRTEGYHLSDTYQGADVVIVNTCGFLNSARSESLQAIGEALAENGRVIVTGCLGGDEAAIRAQHPEVLAVTGPHQFEAVLEAVHQAAPPPALSHGNLLPPQGVKLTPSHYAYLKISEGCDHHCSFCIIPSLRGRLASRPAAEILDEAERLAIAGVQELLIISQDTAAYGRDIGHASSLWQGREIPAHIVDLLEALAQFGLWLRLHYVYPYPLVDRLIPLMAEGKVLPYLDVPFQHASPAVLRAMRRPAAQEKVLERIANWRQQVPDLTLRSTFIVGFPGETEEDFRQLLDWLEAAQLDRVGCFKYEPVAGAAANQLADPVDEALKEDRWHRLMATQRAISARRLARKIGQTLEVLVDEVDEDGAFARSSADSPEVDGCVFLNGETHVAPGDRIEVKIDHADDYDLWGHRVDA